MKRIFLLGVLVALWGCEKDTAPAELTSSDVSIALKAPANQAPAKGVATDGVSRLEVVVAVGSGFDVETVVASLPDAESGTLLLDSAQPELTEATSQGVVKGDKIFYTYTYVAPETMPGTGAGASQTVNVSVEVTCRGGKPVSQQIAIELVRPPVLMAHGLASNAATFDPLVAALKASGAFPENGIKALDYSSTALASYETNRNVVPDQIAALKASYAESGYAVQKVSLIGHSMGGLLSRIYLQSDEYRDDIYQLIGIDVPHSGSQLADLGIDLAKRYPQSLFSIIGQFGAIVDLQVASTATASLNGPSLNKHKVPSHDICATITLSDGVSDLVANKEYLTALLAFVGERTMDRLYTEPSDVVVPLSSQQGGLPEEAVSQFKDQWHCSIHTTAATAERVLELLKSNPSAAPYTSAGFAPPTLTYTTGSAMHLHTIADNGVPVEITKGRSSKVDVTGFGDVDSSIAVLWDPKAKAIVDFYLGIPDPTSFRVSMPKDATGDLNLFILGYDNASTWFYTTSRIIRPI